MTTWRQGRCLPYGEGVTFWALGEIVKAHAGILDTDEPRRRGGQARGSASDGEDRDWFGQRLRALLGLEAPPADREENFTAWLRFLEEIADRRADRPRLRGPALGRRGAARLSRAPRDHLDAVPLLVVGTARPELFEKHAGFAAGGSRVNRIGLEPLSGPRPSGWWSTPGEIGGLGGCGRGDRAPLRRQPLLRRGIGRGSLAETATAALPASVQAVIAARLDALPAEHKAVLGDAAVVGGVFWNGAVVALDGRDADEVDHALRSLVDRQLIRRVRASSMHGENEFAFAHALAREVAYQELPRNVRAAKHFATARWLEDKLGGRVREAVEVLAHHYATALDMAFASGDKVLADQLRAPAIENLRLAGDHVMRLDVGAAEQLYKKAMDLLDTDDSRRATLLRSWGWSLLQRGRYVDAAAAFGEASDLYRARGQRTDLALALNGLGVALTHLGRPWRHLVDEMLDLISTEEASPEAGEVLTAVASIAIYEADYQRGIALLERVREMYAQLGLAAPATVSFWEAQARCGLGDAQAPRVLRESLAELIDEGYSREAGLLYINSTALLSPYEGSVRLAAFCEEGLEFASQRGMDEAVSMLADNRAAHLFTIGRWPEALRELDRIDTSTPDDEVSQRMYNRLTRAQLLVRMGRYDEAEADAAWAEQRARDTGVEALADYAALVAASVQASTRSTEESADKLAEVLGHDRPPVIRGDEELFPWLSSVALDDDRPELVGRMMESLKTAVPLCDHVLVNCRALLEEHGNDHAAAAAGFADAAARWHDFGMPYEEGQALLGQGRCLMALGRAPEAAAPLAAAREIFARLGAEPALARRSRSSPRLRPEGSS